MVGNKTKILDLISLSEGTWAKESFTPRGFFPQFFGRRGTTLKQSALKEAQTITLLRDTAVSRNGIVMVAI